MDTLGQRIKTIRKHKKMTLVDVAGSKMTKGMLSLIENNKAQPSMENLNYIASQLQIEVGDLTDEITTQQLRNYIDQIRIILPNNESITVEKAVKIEELLLPIIHQLPDKYESVQIMNAYLNIFIPLKRYADGIKQCNLTLEFLEKLSLYTDYIETLRKKSTLLFFLDDYNGAYDTILVAYRMIQSNYYSVDLITKVQALYQTSTMSLAVDLNNNTSHLIDDLISFCHQEKIYFFYMHILRLATFAESTKLDPEKIAHYRSLVDNYRQFDSSEETLQLYYLYYVFYYSQISKEPEKVIEYGHLYNEIGTDFAMFVSFEMGKAYYLLGKYNLAKLNFNSLVIDFDYSGMHPVDRSRIQECFAYKALTHSHFNENEEALKAINKALKETKTTSTNYSFIKEVHSKLTSK